MTIMLEALPKGTIAALERAVRTAAEWRGYYTHDQIELAAFDAEILRMRNALAAVKRQQRALRHLLNSVSQARELGVAVTH